MRYDNKRILKDAIVALSDESKSFDLQGVNGFSITAEIALANQSDQEFGTGTMDVKTFTFPAKASATAGDHIIFYDKAGTAWGISLDVSGTDDEPTSDEWAALGSGNKAHVDISGGTDAASVAALVETAVDALTGFTSVITTDDSAGDGTMTFTQVVPGEVQDAVPLSADGSGAGSITVANSTPGVETDVNIDDDTVSIPDHGYTTGAKCALTSTGTLPTGLSTGSDYYIIVVDENTIAFASSQSNASAGTKVDITGYGTSAAVHTVDIDTTIAGSVKLQKSNTPTDKTPVWIDIDNSSTNFTDATNLDWDVPDAYFKAVKAVIDVTSGTVEVNIDITAKS